MVRKVKQSSVKRTEVDACRFICSVGVGLYQLHLRLVDLDPNDWYAEWKASVNEIAHYSLVLGEFANENEAELTALILRCPQDITMVATHNPLHSPDIKRDQPIRDDLFDGFGDFDS